MLQSISWSDFINALLVLLAVYYAVVVAMFYTRDIVRSLQRPTEAEDSTEKSINENSSVIGEPKSLSASGRIETIAEVQDSDVVVNSTVEPQDESTWNAAPLVTNPLHRSFAQLVEEVNALAYIVSKNDKEEISLLFETLLSRYPQLARPHYQASINQFIIEACHLHGASALSHAEIDAWWQRAAVNE